MLWKKKTRASLWRWRFEKDPNQDRIPFYTDEKDAMIKISALVIARNEESRLEACLSHLKFADECVVVLDRTTDRSKEIALSCGATLYEGSFEKEGDRRNFGLSQCQGEWILEVDADEWVSPELAQEIRILIESPTADWWEVPIDNYIGPRLVRYGWGGSFGTTAVPRLFKKGVKVWGPQRLHPSVTFLGKKGPRLKGVLVHHLDKDLSDTLKRFNSYTLARAKDLAETRKIDKTSTNVRRFFFRFYKCFVRRKGYKEGALGFFIAVLTGLYPLVSTLKAQEILKQKP